MAQRAVPRVTAKVTPERSDYAPGSPAITVRGVSKSFPGVRALVDVDVDILRGEIHCWIGENGAGKSTLIKILAGAQSSDSGQILLDGREVSLSSPTDAMQQGLSFILQELSVVDGITVADNILLGHEVRRGPQVRRAPSNVRAAELLETIGFGHVSPTKKVGQLSTAEKQAVMVARALHLEARVVFFDETTSTLDSDEARLLFDVMRTLRDKGKSVVFVTHRLQEVSHIADRVTVFKDGQVVKTLLRSELAESEMVRLMVGREISTLFPPKGRAAGDVTLAAKGVGTVGVRDLTLDVRSGEVLGISGLVGSGRTEVLRALFGIDRLHAGVLEVDGKPIVVRSIRDAIRRGIAMVPEDRRSQGIIALRSVEENLTITWTDQTRVRGWRRKAVALAEGFVRELNVRTPSARQPIGLLSGGNQQKVVVSRWLAIRPRVLLLDEPTRGIDVGAKAEIYRLVDKLAREGLAVVMVSSDLPEILGLSDRIVVMQDGTVAGELPGTASEEDVVALAMSHGGIKS